MKKVTKEEYDAALLIVQAFQSQENPPLSELSLEELDLRWKNYRKEAEYWRRLGSWIKQGDAHKKMIEIGEEIAFRNKKID